MKLFRRWSKKSMMAQATPPQPAQESFHKTSDAYPSPEEQSSKSVSIAVCVDASTSTADAPLFQLGSSCFSCSKRFQRPSRCRHHCRNCGRSCCRKCLSKTKREIPWLLPPYLSLAVLEGEQDYPSTGDVASQTAAQKRTNTKIKQDIAGKVERHKVCIQCEAKMFGVSISDCAAAAEPSQGQNEAKVEDENASANENNSNAQSESNETKPSKTKRRTRSAKALLLRPFRPLFRKRNSKGTSDNDNLLAKKLQEFSSNEVFAPSATSSSPPIVLGPLNRL